MQQYTVLLLFSLLTLALPAQTTWQAGLAIPDTSLTSVDLVALPDGDVLVLGKRELHDLFPGFPIEGYLTYGSYLARISATGEVLWEQKDLPTGFIASPGDLNAQGRQPAPTLLVDPATGTWTLPYTVYAGELECVDPSVYAYSTRPGLVRGSLTTGAVLSDTVYMDGTECGIEWIMRAFRHGAGALAVTQHSQLGTQVLRFDAQGGLTRVPFENDAFFLQDIAQDPLTTDLLAVGDDFTGQLSVLRTDTAGVTLQTYPLSEVLLRLYPLPDGTGYLGSGIEPTVDTLLFGVYRLDTAFAVQWTYLTPNSISAVTPAPDGTTLVLEGSNSGLNQTFVRVARLDAQGQLVGTHDYPGEDLYPGSIVATGDSCYVFTTTTFDLFEHPDPAVITVTADCLRLTTAAPEPVGPGLAVAPNPVVDRAEVRWSEPAPAGTVLEVRTAEGRVVETRSVAGQTAATLLVADWPAGVYLVAVRGVGAAVMIYKL